MVWYAQQVLLDRGCCCFINLFYYLLSLSSPPLCNICFDAIYYYQVRLRGRSKRQTSQRISLRFVTNSLRQLIPIPAISPCSPKVCLPRCFHYNVEENTWIFPARLLPYNLTRYLASPHVCLLYSVQLESKNYTKLNFAQSKQFKKTSNLSPGAIRILQLYKYWLLPNAYRAHLRSRSTDSALKRKWRQWRQWSNGSFRRFLYDRAPKKIGLQNSLLYL